MNTRHRTILAILLFCFSLLALPVSAEWFRDEREMMGTRVTVEIEAHDQTRAASLAAEVFAEIQRLDLMMNPWNSASELASVNRKAAVAPVATTPEIIDVIQRARYYSELSGGAFDISFASVGQHYDYRAGKAPGESELQAGRSNINYRAIVVDAGRDEVRFTKPGLQIDLGGIAKGYAVDRGIEMLRAAGIDSAVVSAGGDSRLLGGKSQEASDRPRTVGIRHPRREGEFAVLIPLADTAISTSGDYERFFIADGVRHHHILDPQTGESAREVQSASILASEAIDSDALSTTVFVLGVEKGLALVNSLPGVDAIIIDGAGKLHYSAELLRSVQTGQD